MKKYFKFKTLLIVWIIYLIGIPLYYTPYELQPSYWQFRKMCELNNLPKSQEKYNRILSYFGKKLGDKDDFLVKRQKKGENYFVALKNFNKRLEIEIYIAYKDKENKKLSFDSIETMFLFPTWKTYRPILYGNEGSMNFTWDLENEIYCGYSDIIKQRDKKYLSEQEWDKKYLSEAERSLKFLKELVRIQENGGCIKTLGYDIEEVHRRIKELETSIKDKEADNDKQRVY